MFLFLKHLFFIWAAVTFASQLFCAGMCLRKEFRRDKP